MATKSQRRSAPGRYVPPPESHVAKSRRAVPIDFEILVPALTPSLQRFAESKLQDHERAAEAVQDAWYAAWRVRQTFTSVDHLTRWLFRVVRYRWVSTIRKQRRMTLVESASDSGEEPGFSLSPAKAPLQSTGEVHEKVREVIDRLPETYRGAAILHFLCGHHYTSVAHLLRLSPNTVKMRLHRARDRLRRALRRYAPG